MRNPPNWIAILSFIASFIIFPLAIFASVLDNWLNVYALLACIFCIVPFLYTMFISVVFCVRLYRKLMREADKHAFTRKLHKNYEFRSLAFTLCSFVSNIGYTIVLMALGLQSESVWFGASAVYYILLSSARGGVLLQNVRDERRYKNDEVALQRAKAGTYRYCGIVMIALTMAMAMSVVHTMGIGVGETRSPVWTVYLLAAYALYRIVASGYNFVKASKQDDFAVRSVRYLNLAAALVSLLTLQTALFNTFFSEVDPLLFTAVSGFTVCVIMLSLGIYIISFSSAVRKNLKAKLLQKGESAEGGAYNRDGYAEEYTNGADLGADPDKTAKGRGQVCVENEIVADVLSVVERVAEADSVADSEQTTEKDTAESGE